jgi:hypothetical protein
MRPLEGVFGGGGDVNAMAADVVVARISAEAVMSPRAIVMVDTKICDVSMVMDGGSPAYYYE